MDKVGMISLGCSKNRVDSEHILGSLADLGFVFTSEPGDADILVVNTCGFITPAKEESINTILEMAEYKKHGKCRLLVVAGCLSERYGSELEAELPEVDLFWGVKDQRGLAKRIAELNCGRECETPGTGRILTTPPYSAYLRIADGCDNRCTYCAIPLIRGPRVSVPMDELISEADALAQSGVRELTLIAQDTSAYGLDIYEKPMLAQLMSELCGIDGLHWIRVLYTYPSTVDEKLIDTIASHEKLVNYIDMPIQHIDDGLLLAMNRKGDAAHIRRMIDCLRGTSDDFILRSTVITGFPGEDEAAFRRLADFVAEGPFDRLGAFAYSEEEGTPAAEFANRVPEPLREERRNEIMRLQQAVSLAANIRRIGTKTEVLIEDVKGGVAYGRSYGEAPEVDGSIAVSLTKGAQPGDFIRAAITEANEYDLFGEQI